MKATYTLGVLVLVSLFLQLSLPSAFAAKISDLVEIIGAYPSQGSQAEKDDFETLLRWQEVRTPEQCAKAETEASISFESFFGGDNGPLSPQEIKRLKHFFYWHFARAGIPTAKLKDHFQRPRPYDYDLRVKPCVHLADGYAYPSGHTSTSRAIALVLAKKFPERAELLLKRADEIALNRIIGGVHHPSDIVAGKKLADVLYQKLIADRKFLFELQAL